MAYDTKLLSAAHRALEQEKQKNDAMYDRRLAEVYGALPRVRDIDLELRRTVAKAVSLALSQGLDPERELESVRRENLALQAERGELLVSHGLPADYTDPRPMCPDCNDSGYMKDGRVCSCLHRRYTALLQAELAENTDRAADFSRFSLDVYSAETDDTGVSPRENMEQVLSACRTYAARFGKNSPNLFFCGGTGLGKTFLASCIARTVAEKGNWVVYAPAFELLRSFEQERFAGEAEAGEDTRRYLKCDLLIIDDLGTEFITSFVVSALYHIINTRLTSGKKTVITSNLTQQELSSRYSAQIASRLEGEYLPLRFTGTDVRLKKNI